MLAAFLRRRALYSRIALARSLMPRLDEPYAVPAWHDAAPTGRDRPSRRVCPGCERPYAAESRAVEGQLCRTFAPGELEDVPIVRGTGEPVF